MKVTGSQDPSLVGPDKVISRLAFQIKSNEISLITGFLKRILVFVAIHNGINYRYRKHLVPGSIVIFSQLDTKFIFLSCFAKNLAASGPALIHTSSSFPQAILPYTQKFYHRYTDSANLAR